MPFWNLHVIVKFYAVFCGFAENFLEIFLVI